MAAQVLIDDPSKTVIEPLAARSESFPKLYDFDLMKSSGHLTGWHVGEILDETVDQTVDQTPFGSF